MSSGNLLDTNAVLLGLTQPEELSHAALDAIERGPNIISSAVYWEVVLKSLKGKLHIGDPAEWWGQAVEDLCATVLPIRPEHIDWIQHLPDIHQDPFDRLLIAQALHEDLRLVTRDGEIPKYTGQPIGRRRRQLEVVS